MLIRSRPQTKQACEPIVEAALKQLFGSQTNAIGRIITLDEHERGLANIMSTLKMTGIITDYVIGATRETKQSTYEKTEWLIRIKFTDDPTKKTGYVADLLFHYTH